jgi:predicted 2-oxoglutarate/Fe(II)-dependent dioxygenase YbiX
MNQSRYDAVSIPLSQEEMLEISNLKFENHGGAVLRFKNVFEVDFPKVSKWIDARGKKAHEQRWKYKTDKNGVRYAENEDGNKFTIEQAEMVPVRVLQPVEQDTEEEMVQLFQDWERAIYKCLIRYIDEYPLVLGTLWWRNRGHILRYDKGTFLGLHNDNDTNYRATGGKRYIPYGQLGSRQSLAALLYINDCVDAKEKIDGTNYMGGELYFPYLDIDVSAKAGDIVIFPTNFVASHGVKEVTDGIRYAYLEFYSQGSPDANVRIEVVEPNEMDDWCKPHWIDSIYDDYWEYAAKYNSKVDSDNPIYSNRNLEGDDGMIGDGKSY